MSNLTMESIVGGNEFENMLSSIIIVLLIIIVFKWCKTNNTSKKNKRNCDCEGRECTCKTTLNFQQRCRIGCPGGKKCICCCPPLQCGCKMSCPCNAAYSEHMEQENLENNNNNAGDDSISNYRSQDVSGHNSKNVTSMGPIPKVPSDKNMSDWQGSITKGMSLEEGVSESHARYCDSLSFAGMPTGASSCTTLEENGRSEGTANFVGLTARKFCKARQLAAPGCDARQTPSHMPTEWCNIDMDGLV